MTQNYGQKMVHVLVKIVTVKKWRQTKMVRLCKVCDFEFPPDFNGIVMFNETCGKDNHKGNIVGEN